MENANPPLPLGRLLLTGAAGALGRQLRPRLRARCTLLRVSDIAAMEPAAAGEEVVQAPLEDQAAVHALLQGIDSVVHLGGVSTEQPWQPILQANIIGLYNLYEGARRNGVRRILFASSNHACGFYRQDQVIGTEAPPRPDGLYGLSKAFGENIAHLYWDRYGIETLCLRIGSCFPEPKDRRMLSTWLSYDDLERMVIAGLTAPVVGHNVIYGISDNRSRWYDNTGAAHIGYRPQDSSEPYRAALEAAQPAIDRKDPAMVFQGGVYVRTGPFE